MKYVLCHSGRFLPAQIVEAQQNGTLKIHYEGYALKFDVFVDRKDTKSFARYRSISCRPNTVLPILKLGDIVSVKLNDQWRPQRILNLDNTRKQGTSGQFRTTSKRWFHPDDTNNVRMSETRSRSKKRGLSTTAPRNPSKRRRINSVFDRTSYRDLRECSRTIKLERTEGPQEDDLMVDLWSVFNVVQWFEQRGFLQERDPLARNFYKANINGARLLSLNKNDLWRLGFIDDHERILHQRDVELKR